MKEQEIIEGNKLIAEFMGAVPIEEGSQMLKFDLNTRHVVCSEGNLKFDTSWDWLMPVVEKIELLGFWFNIKKNHVTVAWDNKGNHGSKMIHSEFGNQSKMERVYSCVISFIKFYNYE